MKSITTVLTKSWIYLKRYPHLVGQIIGLSILVSALESFSVGAVIPFLQLLLTPATSLSYSTFLTRFFPINSPNFSTWLIVAFLTLFLSRSLLQYWNTISINRLTNLIRRDLQVELFDALSTAQLAFFTHKRTGDLVSTVSTYTDNISQSIFALLQTALFSFRCIAYIALLFVLSWKITSVVVLLCLLALPVTLILLKRLAQIGGKIAEKISAINVQLFDLLRGIPLMKIFGMEDIMKNRFYKTSTEFMSASVQGTAYYSVVSPVTEITFGFTIIGLGVVGLRVGPQQLSSYLPYALPYLFALFQAYSQGNNLLNSITKLAHNSAPLESYEHLYTEALKARLPKSSITIPPFKKSIEFQKVSFGYNKDETILNEISLTIPYSRWVAIIGPTGVGKSTIAHLLAGLYRPTGGQIAVDGSGLDQASLESWQRQIGYVPQDTIVFNDTVQANIAYGQPEAPLAEIIEAAEIAHIHSFFNSLPEKYETMLGEHGTRLSGGQRQRLTLARALLTKPAILILDEATSALDAVTEESIHQILKEKNHHQTIVTISHRPSALRHADLIYVLLKGKVVEQGTHDELISHGSTYKTLYQLS